MFHIGFTPSTYPANAMSAKHETLMGAIAQLFADLGLAYGPEEWFVARILEATKEAVDNLEDGSKPACGLWSDMGCEDDAFSINVFVDDSEAIYIKHGDQELLAPHGAVGFVLDKHCERWIYNDHEIAEWDNVMLLSLNEPSDGPVIPEVCEHTGMTRDELESICGRVEPIIESIDRQIKNGDCTLVGLFSDNAERKLFSFYVDELSFDDSELIGKTETEAHHLNQQKTVAYLQA